MKAIGARALAYGGCIVAALAVGSGGCGGSPSLPLEGRLTFADGVYIWEVALPSGRHERVRVAGVKPEANELISEVAGSRRSGYAYCVTPLMGEARVRWVDPESTPQGYADLGLGEHPALVGDAVVFFKPPEGKGQPSHLGYVKVTEPGHFVTLMEGPPDSSVGEAWSDMTSAPVEVAPGECASIDRSLALVRISIFNRRVVPLGHRGFVPLVWLPRRRLLVCRARFDVDSCVGVDIANGAVHGLPALRGMVGWASADDGGRLLVSAAPRNGPPTSTYNIYEYDFEDDTLHVVLTGARMLNGGTWRHFN